jgi:hypothetical protein
LQSSLYGSTDIIDDEVKANDSSCPQALPILSFGSEGADCKGKNEKAIGQEEIRP